jgi:phosphoserine phosphatase RsbU/P
MTVQSMPFLEVENGPEMGKRYPLLETGTVLGRHPDCHIVVEVGAVSRHHAKILIQDGKYHVEDLKSRNGTFLNESPVQGRTLLRSGDRLRVCDITFVFFGDEDSAMDTMDSTSSMSAFALADDDSGSTIMSKLDVSSRGGLQVTASSDAKLRALLEINRSLARALKLDDVLPTVLETLFRIFVQADRGFIVLQAPNGQLIPRWMKLRREGTNETVRISRTIVKEVMRAREAILSADAATDDRFEMSQSIADFRIRSMMCAPLLDSEGESLGVIQIDTVDQRKRFENEDLEILVAVAAQAGIAIDNARMYENALRQRAFERDLELAHEVQQGFLPHQPPELSGYNFFDFYRPANHVGGDYYDYIQLSEGRVAIVVADVVGHGVAAALLMAKLSAEARYCLASQPNAGHALTELNRRFCGPRADRFVTIVMAILDPKKHTVTIVNGGHMAPLWRKTDGTLVEAGEDVASVPIGIMDDATYEQETITLGPGESLMLYTDGVNEAMNDADEMFTIDRLREVVEEFPGGVAGCGRKLIELVQAHMGTTPQTDDMCVVCFGRV